MTDKLDLLRRGRCDELREQLTKLETKIKRCSEETLYQASMVMGIDEIDAEATLQAAQELKAAKDKYQAVKAELAKLES